MGLGSWWRSRQSRRGHPDGTKESKAPGGNPDGERPKPKRQGKSSQRIELARLPSRLLVDVDFLKEQGPETHDASTSRSQSQRCQLIHLVVDSVKVLDAASLPPRKKAVEQEKVKSFCTVSIGKQTFVTPDQAVQKEESGDDQHPFSIKHGCGATFVVSEQGATKLRVGVYCRGRLDGALKNKFVGYSLVDLDPLIRAAIRDDMDVALDGASRMSDGKLPSHLYESKVDVCAPSGDVVVGELTINARAAGVAKLEEELWIKLLTIGDWDESDGLDFDEFRCVMQAFGSDASDEDYFGVFERARELEMAQASEKDAETATKLAVVSIARALSTSDDGDELPGANLSRFVPYCPVDGAVFPTDPASGASNVLYCWLALSQSVGDAGGEMKAGYLTESEASRAWALKLTEWNGIHYPRRAGRKSGGSSASKRSAKQLGGLRVGSSAHSILLFDRTTKQVIEEIVSPLVIMAMRTLYQSKIGRRFLRNSGFLARMCDMSVSEGAYRDSEESAKDIAPFIESFRGQLDMSSAEKPAGEYSTFNEFFSRKLRPGARPVGGSEDVVVSAADCRLNVYESVDDATRFWVKGRNFSLAGLLADEALAGDFHGGSMAIFRLAPQDYHRYHAPVAGTIVSITDVPGQLLTVNPIAVNCVHADVFTVNKRSVMLIDTPDLGRVAFVAIGATLVGTIVWTAEVGDVIDRGRFAEPVSRFLSISMSRSHSPSPSLAHSLYAGTELGYFKFGGSTCIALFAKDAIKFDEDVSANSMRSLETLVRMGEPIGVRCGRTMTPGEALLREEMLTAATAAAEFAGVLSLDERLLSMRLTADEEEEDGGLSTVVDYGN